MVSQAGFGLLIALFSVNLLDIFSRAELFVDLKSTDIAERNLSIHRIMITWQFSDWDVSDTQRL